MALIAVLGRSQAAALVAVGITGIPSFARITRAQVLSLRKRDFVIAVEALGGSSLYSMFRTVLPNAWSPILVQVVVLSSVAILLEAALSFLGVGIPPPTPSWGEMLRTGKSYLYESPTYAVLPGLALTLTILSLDALGRAPRRGPGGAAGPGRRSRTGHRAGMIGFVARRLAQLLPVLLIASIGIWGMIYAVPGGPVGSIVGQDATPEQIARNHPRLGLDRPVLVQYWSWLIHAAATAISAPRSRAASRCSGLIVQRIPATLQLGLAATLVGLLLGVPVALASALRHRLLGRPRR